MFKGLVGYDAIIPIVDGLEALGYIESIEGKYYPQFKRVSRMRALAPFIRKLESEHHLNGSTIVIPELFSPDTAIELRDKGEDGKKEAITFEDNEDTLQLRADITRYNALLWNTYIDANLTYIEPDTSCRYDLTKKSVRAIFSNGSFDEGGRL
jgi:hypothetical protein